MQITLTAKQHAFIIAFLPERGEKQTMKYINKVLQQLEQVRNNEQQITVDVTPEFIVNLYQILGTQQGRLTTRIIKDLKPLIFTQVSEAVQAQLIQVDAQNNKDEASVIDAAFDFLYEVKG